MAQEKPFTALEVAIGLGVPPGRQREDVAKAVRDFVRRGEIIELAPDQRRKRKKKRFLYNHEWRKKQKGVLNRRIFKAMYVCGSFTVSEVVRLTGLKRDWVDRLVPRLRKSGFIIPVARRLCAHGAGAERIYHIPDRDRFRLEVLR